MAEPEYYDIFLSYSRRNSRWVQRLAADLESKGVFVWHDTVELTVGDAFRARIESAIERSNYFCLVISPQSLDSYFVRRFELEAAFSLMASMRRTSYILPVIRTHPADRLPLMLQQFQYLDMSTATKYALNLPKLVARASPSDSAELVTLLKRRGWEEARRSTNHLLMVNRSTQRSLTVPLFDKLYPDTVRHILTWA